MYVPISNKLEIESNDDQDIKEVIANNNTTPIDYVKAWDGLRGFFTIFVVLSHLNILRHAWIVIGFFFGHSGILITSMTFNIIEKKGEISLLMFYHRRIARIIPGAFLVIFSCCLYVLYITTFYPDQMSRIELYWQRSDMLWATFYGSNWQLINKGEDYFAQYNNLTLLRHFWSLAIEEQYYIVWPILLSTWMLVIPLILYSCSPRLTPNNNIEDKIQPLHHVSSSILSFKTIVISVLVGDLIVLVISSAYQYYMMQAKTPQYVIYYSTIIHLKEFALGGAGAAIVRLIPSLQGLMHSQQPYVPKYSFHQRLFIEMCIGILMAYPLYLVTLADWKNDEDVFIWYFNYGIFPPLVVVITDILLAIQVKEMIEDEYYYFPVSRLFLSSDFIVFLGRISYQTYLWHVPIIVWTNTACREGVDSECTTNAVVVIAFIYFFTAMMSTFYEFPMQKYILSFKDPRKVIACLLLTMIALAGLICLVTSNYEDPYAYVELEKSVQDFNDDPNNIISLPDVATTYDNNYDNNYNYNNNKVDSVKELNDDYIKLDSTTISSISPVVIRADSVNSSKPIISVDSELVTPKQSKYTLIMERMNKYAQEAHKDFTLDMYDETIVYPSKSVDEQIKSNYHEILKYVNFRDEIKLTSDSKKSLLFILAPNTIDTCNELKNIYQNIKVMSKQSYILYIYLEKDNCKEISKDVNDNLVSFELDNMEPTSVYSNDLYHPIHASTLFDQDSLLPLVQMKYLHRIIIDYLVTSIPKTIRYFKPSTFENFDMIYKEVIKSNTIKHIKKKPLIFNRMKNNSYIANHFYETILLPDTDKGISRSEFKTTFKNVNTLVLNDIINQLKSGNIERINKRYLFILSSEDCESLLSIYKKINNSVNKNNEHYILYIYLKSNYCDGLPKHTDVTHNYVSFELDNMAPGNSYMEGLYHPINATLLLNPSTPLSIAEMKYLHLIIIDHLVTFIPDTIRYFKPSTFENFDMIYKDAINMDKSRTDNSSRYHIVYLGNSVAERYAYLTEHMRVSILANCKTYYEHLDSSIQQNLVSTLLYETLSKIVIRNAATPGYKLIFDLLSDIKLLQEKKDFIINNKVHVVIVEDTYFMSKLLQIDTKYVKNNKNNDKGKRSLKSTSTTEISYETLLNFNKLLLFLDMLHSIGVQRVYLHDINHLNGLSVDSFNKYDITDMKDPHLGYKSIIATLEKNFELCKYLNKSKLDPLCFANKKLDTLKNMLRVVDISYITCPQRSIVKDNKLQCNTNVWGYNPILSDGEHPSGDAGEFCAANVLSQLVQDLYVEALMKQKQSNIFKPKHKVVPDSLLSLYTTSSPLNVCSYHNIKIIS